MRRPCNIRQIVYSLCITMTLVLVGTLSSATAEPFSGTFAGTFTENRIDLNDDGAVGAWDTGRADSTLGEYDFQEAAERQAVADPTSIGCSADELGFELVFANGVGTFADGSQFYGQTDESPLCFDPVTGGFTGTAKFTIIGGIGRFEGATGSGESTFSGFYLVFDDSPESNQGFGPFSGSFTGDIIIPPGIGEPLDCNNDGVVNGLDIISAGC